MTFRHAVPPDWTMERYWYDQPRGHGEKVVFPTKSDIRTDMQNANEKAKKLHKQVGSIGTVNVVENVGNHVPTVLKSILRKCSQGEEVKGMHVGNHARPDNTPSHEHSPWLVGHQGKPGRNLHFEEPQINRTWIIDSGSCVDLIQKSELSSF